MIISASHLSMDASTGHMDVNKTERGTLISRNHSGRNEPLTAPHFPLLETIRRTEQLVELNGLKEAHATATAESTQSNSSTEGVLERTVAALTNRPAQLRSRPTTRFPELFLGQLNNHMNTSAKRFYHLGGQQFSLNFTAHRAHVEYEFMDFHSNGTVATADGRSIDFSLDVSIQRTSIVQHSVFGQVAAGRLVDPLVLHFDHGIDKLTERSFLFDLDGDGAAEDIFGLKPGSGFLALDLDGDSSITSGRELFGPTSGSGFQDLAVHDVDENMWIDENDPIYSKLLVWMNPSEDTQELLSLKEAGVGAISLSHAGSLFNLKSSENILLGQIMASGIFLTENGGVRSLQDINVAADTESDNTHASIGDPQSESDSEADLQALRAIISFQRRRLETLAGLHRFSHQADDEDERRWHLLDLKQDTSKT